jgi:hypothetical protein
MTLAGTAYPLATCYGLPDFDRPSHLSELAATTVQRRLLAAAKPGQTPAPAPVLVWNPGQGHLPAWLARAAAADSGSGGSGDRRVTVVSRDALQLLATRANLDRVGIPEHAVALRHQVGLDGTPGEHRLALLHPDDDLPPAARDSLFATLASVLAPGAPAVLYGGAPAIAPLLGRRRPFSLLRESRRRALRVAILNAPAA